MAIKLSDIKAEIKKSGSSKGKFLYFKAGEKVRVRFLTEFEEGMEIPFHDSFKLGINVPCQELFGRSCPYCENEDLRTRNMYAWSVYDYDSQEVKILMAAVNQCSPVGALASVYETYGSITDRDYEIKQIGEKQNKSFTVLPLDPRKFRGKAKPLSEQSILKYIDKAYPADDVDEDEDEEEAPRPKTKGGKTKTKTKPKPEPEEDEWDEDDEEEMDYSSMKPQELYRLCKERDIDCKPKKSKEYYIDLLEEADEESDDGWGDDEDEDDWDE